MESVYSGLEETVTEYTGYYRIVDEVVEEDWVGCVVEIVCLLV